MWIFGYGSLIWRVDFPYKARIAGFIKGYVRRFYQASVDHRGIPEKPGRVVTLLPSPDESAMVWGVAYQIADDDIPGVLGHLDYREKCGYVKTPVIFHPDSNSGLAPFQLYVYIGEQNNDWYLGEADLESMAKQIAECSGPSGTNKEYLFNLAAAMRTLAPDYHDSHLFELEQAVKNIVHNETVSGAKTC